MLNWRDPANPKAGGAERVSQGYLAALAARGHQIVWFSWHFPGASFEEQIGDLRVVRGGGMFTSLLAARQWFRRQPRFDLVIDQHHGIPWLAPWWCGTNCVAYIHEVLGPIWNSFYPWPVSAIGRLQERWTHWLYRRVPFWTVCESTRRCLEQHGVRSVTVWPNGIDTRPLPELEPKLIGTPLRLVAVSRLAPNKRIDHAILALKVLRERAIDAELRIVGSGDLEPELQRLVDRLNLRTAVSFLGHLTEGDKDRELRGAHLLLHTSVREGWGLNVIEANAMGTPAVVYPVGGLVDSTLDGQTGLVTTSETPESAADAVAQLLRDPERYQRMRRNAWERSLTFEWDRVLPPACDWLERMAVERR